MSDTEQQPKKKQGFAVMNPEQHRELSRRGGVAAHTKGTAHEFTSAEARAAGSKGGMSYARKIRAREYEALAPKTAEGEE